MLKKSHAQSQVREIQPDPTPIFLRVHTRVVGEKPRKEREGSSSPDKWAHFALVFDCETTTDIRQDLNFLWWRFCELKGDVYVCQREGVVYSETLPREEIKLIQNFASSKRAKVEEGCPEDILVQSRTEFVDGEFWQALQAGAVVVCFNAPFDLGRLALEYREAQSKNTGWSMVLWHYQGKPDKFKKGENQAQGFPLSVHQPRWRRSKQSRGLSRPFPRFGSARLGTTKQAHGP